MQRGGRSWLVVVLAILVVWALALLVAGGLMGRAISAFSTATGAIGATPGTGIASFPTPLPFSTTPLAFPTWGAPGVFDWDATPTPDRLPPIYIGPGGGVP